MMGILGVALFKRFSRLCFPRNRIAGCWLVGHLFLFALPGELVLIRRDCVAFQLAGFLCLRLIDALLDNA
jgi:hypothetical protein